MCEAHIYTGRVSWRQSIVDQETQAYLYELAPWFSCASGFQELCFKIASSFSEPDDQSQKWYDRSPLGLSQLVLPSIADTRYLMLWIQVHFNGYLLSLCNRGIKPVQNLPVLGFFGMMEAAN